MQIETNAYFNAIIEEITHIHEQSFGLNTLHLYIHGLCTALPTELQEQHTNNTLIPYFTEL